MCAQLPGANCRSNEKSGAMAEVYRSNNGSEPSDESEALTTKINKASQKCGVPSLMGSVMQAVKLVTRNQDLWTLLWVLPIQRDATIYII